MRFLFLLLMTLACGAEDLRILTFNVRLPSPNDGPDLWAARREFLVETVRKLDPDIMGTQELFHEQGEYIVQSISTMKWFGLSRRGNQADEHMGVFYQAKKWKPSESGNYWLSETPEVAGSSNWGMSLPRMVTWALFESGKRKFYLLNTHFPHRGQQDEKARMECAKVIRQWMKRLPADVPVIITGDFNAPAGGEVYKIMSEGLTDAWLAAENKEGPEGTFHGFKGTPGAARIDWILFRGPWKVKRAETVTANRGGRYPSDHFPVIAELVWP